MLVYQRLPQNQTNHIQSLDHQIISQALHFLYMFVAEEFEVYSMDKEVSLPEICRRLFKRTHHSQSSWTTSMSQVNTHGGFRFVMRVSSVIIQSWMIMTLYRNNLGDDWGSPVKAFYLGPQLVRRVRLADFAPAGGTPATITLKSDGQRLLKAREGSSSAEGMAKNLPSGYDKIAIENGHL